MGRKAAPQCPSKAMSERTGTPNASNFLEPPKSGRSMTKQAASTSAPSLPKKLHRAFGRAAGGDKVVDEDHALVRGHEASSCISISSSPYSSE